MISFVPAIRSGIHASWIGEAVTNHFFSRAPRVESERPISINFIVGKGKQKMYCKRYERKNERSFHFFLEGSLQKSYYEVIILQHDVLYRYIEKFGSRDDSACTIYTLSDDYIYTHGIAYIHIGPIT